MSTSRHPVALRLERRVGRGTELLATVMALPLVDGIFPALVLAGALSSALGILEVGLLVFGGSATLAVVLAEMEGSRRERAEKVLLVGGLVTAVAAAEAALAPTIAELLNLPLFKRFAALVILAVAAKTVSATIGEYLPSPAVIVGLGLFASLEPAGASLVFSADPTLVARGAAAGAVGTGFALTAALAGPALRRNVDLDRFRFGSAVALGVLPLELLGVVQSPVPLALSVLAVACLLAIDPGGGLDSTAAATPAGEAEAVADGGANGDADAGSDADRPGPESDPERPPWL
jgi:hypothetical protein